MRIESGYLKQDRLCGQKNNRNAVGNFSDAMNKVRESISNKVSTSLPQKQKHILTQKIIFIPSILIRVQSITRLI